MRWPFPTPLPSVKATYTGSLWALTRTKTLVLDPALLVNCGYIDGSEDDIGNDIAVDSQGNAYVVGDTSPTETSFPVTIGPDLTYNGDNVDAFVAKLNADGTSLIYCGYIGGSSQDGGNSIAIDNLGYAYITGTHLPPKPLFQLRAAWL